MYDKKVLKYVSNRKYIRTIHAGLFFFLLPVVTTVCCLFQHIKICWLKLRSYYWNSKWNKFSRSPAVLTFQISLGLNFRVCFRDIHWILNIVYRRYRLCWALDTSRCIPRLRGLNLIKIENIVIYWCTALPVLIWY